jgi:hypothetical protein
MMTHVDTHEASGVGEVSADLAVNKDLTLTEDPLRLGIREGVLEAVADEDDQREALTKLVGTSGWAGSLCVYQAR